MNVPSGVNTAGPDYSSNLRKLVKSNISRPPHSNAAKVGIFGCKVDTDKECLVNMRTRKGSKQLRGSSVMTFLVTLLRKQGVQRMEGLILLL